MKKLEIVIGNKFLNEFIERMKENDFNNYSVMEIFKSHGEKHGESVGSGFLSASKNLVLICICDEHQYDIFKKTLLEYLRSIDAYICVSEVEEL